LVISPRTPSFVVSTYLQRSQQQPLDLEIDLRQDVSCLDTREQVLATWRLVKTSAPRWRRLVLQIGPHDATEISEDLRELGTPILEELRISSASHVSGLTKIFEGGAPSLKSLHLIGISLERFSPSIEQLTSLHLASNRPMQYSTFQNLIGKMSKLEDLTLRGRIVEGWPLYPSEEDTITLPSLKALKLSDRRWPLFIPLISVSAPNLHSLSLYELVSHDLPEKHMETHICNNFPSLRNLVVKGKSSYIDNNSFTQLSRIFPVIEHFSLFGVDDFFVRESTRSLHELALWPKLRTISMTPLPSENMLCSLISARTRPTTKATALKTLGIPIPGAHFKRVDWINQQVTLEECRNASSFSFSLLASESAFSNHSSKVY